MDTEDHWGNKDVVYMHTGCNGTERMSDKSNIDSGIRDVFNMVDDNGECCEGVRNLEGWQGQWVLVWVFLVMVSWMGCGVLGSCRNLSLKMYQWQEL